MFEYNNHGTVYPCSGRLHPMLLGIFLCYNRNFVTLLFPQLLDLCILDVNSLDFQYRTLAAAALCHYTSVEVVKKASGKVDSCCDGS